MDMKIVPATPSVIAWAIRESGYSLRALATMLQISESEIEGWTQGTRPEFSKLQKFADAIHRPFAAFLLPGPPAPSGSTVKFRSAKAAGERRALNPEERRRIREAMRLQEIVSWLGVEMHLPPPDVPLTSIQVNPEEVALSIRARLGVAVKTQLSWSSPIEALRTWREAVESLGVTVFMLPMGEESCRGFSVWDENAPLITINTAWSPEARVYTLFHELAHLATRTNSACADDAVPRSSSAGDRTERWCERVAAAVVIPTDALADLLENAPEGKQRRQADLSTATWVAASFRVSRRAAALRLIECGKASWPLYKSIPPNADRIESQGGGTGRSRVEIRRQNYGQRAMSIFSEAVGRGVIGPADVVDYLGISADVLESIKYPARIKGR